MILPNIILIGFNVVNAYADAYRIKRLNKNIAHGLNFGAYAAITALCVWLFKMPLWYAVTFCVSAFLNRQITFDIPLNLRRGLKWWYVSLAQPPKAFMDRIEVKLFGRNNGKQVAIFYFCFWIISLIFQNFI